MEWNGMEWNGMEWNGMEWNGMEWNGMEWNAPSPKESYGQYQPLNARIKITNKSNVGK